MKESPLILVADDDWLTLQLVTRRLEKRGHRVSDATDGREALEAIREHRPAAAVIDWVMPEMQGDEVCAALRADPEPANIPAVLLTARAMDEEIEEGLGRDVDEYTTKPFHIDELDTALRQLMQDAPPGASRSASRLESGRSDAR